jgi:hypothetical protein
MRTASGQLGSAAPESAAVGAARAAPGLFQDPAIQPLVPRPAARSHSCRPNEQASPRRSRDPLGFVPPRRDQVSGADAERQPTAAELGRGPLRLRLGEHSPVARRGLRRLPAVRRRSQRLRARRSFRGAASWRRSRRRSRARPQSQRLSKPLLRCPPKGASPADVPKVSGHCSFNRATPERSQSRCSRPSLVERRPSGSTLRSARRSPR